jgi:type VI secretion system protein ImpH
MADAGRGPGGDVTARLVKEPQRFDFHQAVRLLERQTGRRVGTDAPPADDPVTLRVQPTLTFSPAAISKFTPATDGPPELSVPFGGLTGPDGVLPQHYTALLQERARAKDSTLRDFLDLFHHRLLSLRMRAWEKANLPVAHEATPDADAGTSVARAVAGFGTPGVQHRTPVSDDTFLHFAGLFAHRPPTAAGLELVLSGYFGWPVSVEQFAGQWLYLQAENRTQLATADRPRGLNARLGHDAVAGRRVWDVQHQVRVRVGPLGFAEFQSLQHGGSARAELEALARVYAGAEFDLEVIPVLAADAVPGLTLEPDDTSGPQLGRTVWVLSHNAGSPAADATFPVG